MEERIINQINEKYNVSIEVRSISRALHLGTGMYEYTAYINDDKLSSFSGYYNSQKDIIYDISMDYILFNHKYRKEICGLINKENTAVRLFVNVEGVEEKINYKSVILKDLDSSYAKKCEIILHIYSFGNVDWLMFQPIIDYLSDYPNSQYFIVFSVYPIEIFNSEDFAANKFSFGFTSNIPDTGFEGVNLDKRLDHFELYDVSYDTLNKSWIKKIAGL